MDNCELFSHVYFATPLITRICPYIDSLCKFGFRVSKINVGPDSGIKMRPVYPGADPGGD